MHVWAIGLNHRSATLDLRERFALDAARIGDALRGLREALAVPAEAAILSTCNRTELYCAAEQDRTQSTLQWLSQVGAVDTSTLMPHVYTWHNHLAAQHAFRVASGLDSMVVGESQILGQLKTAVKLAETQGTLGTTLNQLFQRSFAVAKRVRSSTEIGAHAISMAAAAVKLSSQVFERLEDTRVLLVGAGEMIELCAVHFSARQPRSLMIANRSLPRRQALAERVGAEHMPLVDLPKRLHEFDIVISCTASTLPLIGLGAVESALRQRRRRPIFMLDLAVPRDIEPEVRALQDVYLYTVDDLADIVQRNMDQRQQAITQAETIIGEGVAQFDRWLAQRQQVPLIQQVHALSERWHAQECQRAQRLLERGEPIEAVLESFSRGLRKKMMHPFLQALSSHPGERRTLAESSLRQLMLPEDAHEGNSVAEG